MATNLKSFSCRITHSFEPIKIKKYWYYDILPCLPYYDVSAIRGDLLQKCDNVACVVTQRGGHIGFLDGYVIPSAYTYMNRVANQYFEAIFTRGEELKT